MRIAVQMDALDGINVAGDSSFALMLEAQARGFRDLIEARNFPCAAAILRLQIDTAMRINALSLVDDPDAIGGFQPDGAVMLAVDVHGHGFPLKPAGRQAGAGRGIGVERRGAGA